MGLTSLFLVLPFVASVLCSTLQKRSNSVNNCDHPDCYVFAAELAAGVDWSAAPCDDFYQFACGRWSRHVDNPEMLPMVDPLRLQQAQLDDRLKGILIGNISKEEVALQKAQDLYLSCIRQELYMKFNFDAIKTVINQVGGWPLASGVDNQISNIMSTFLFLKDQKVPFEIAVTSFVVDHSVKYVQILPPSESDLLTSQFPGLTADNILTIANTLFDVADQDSAMNDAYKVLQLDNELRQAITTDTSLEVPTLAQLQVELNYDIISLLNTVFQGIKKFSSTDKIIVSSPTYFKNLFNFINVEDNAMVISNYAILQNLVYALRLVGDSLPSPLREIRPLRTFSDASKEDQCLPLVVGNYDLAIALKYGEVYHHIDAEMKVIGEMTHEIMDTFNDRLDKLDWLDEDSRAAAKYKLSKLKDYYEYPSWVSDLNEVNEYYAGIPSGNVFLANWINSVRHKRQIQLEALVVTPSEKLKWLNSPLEVNAFYAPSENHIHILEAILEAPIFNINRLKLMNYASLGYVLGHEITHGFDNSGVRYDAEGNLKPWLTEETQENFKSRTQCLIDQYSGYELTKEELPGATEGFRVNGSQTLGENVADDGGLKLSYYSYKKWRSETPDVRLPDFLKKNFTEDQVFFLTFARTWCMNYEHDFEYSLEIDVHSPDKFRIIGPLSNFDEFGKAFNCPAGSKMVRGDKACHVW